MSNARNLKRRIKTTGNISQITKAMGAVAASKMKKSQEAAVVGVSYENLMKKMVVSILKFASVVDHPMLKTSPEDLLLPKLVVLIAPDRGLCGSLPTAVMRLAEKNISPDSKVIAVGKKSVVYAKKTEWEVLASFESLGDRPSLADTTPISMVILEEYRKRRVGSLQIIYPKFVNTLTQETTLSQILPLSQLSAVTAEVPILQPVYIFEPGPISLLNELLPAYVRLSIYQAILSAKAAEQSARMMAMKNASDNALEVKNLLLLSYNQSRQKLITAEIADSVTALLAIK